MSDWTLTESERSEYDDSGFFVRESVFSAVDLDSFRAAAERVARHASREVSALDTLDEDASGREYCIDGNRYVEAEKSTIQLEHESNSKTIRVIEPFHHLDPVFDAMIEDPRIVTPVGGLLRDNRVALWTDKINLKRPREGSRFRWHQDSPYWRHACGHCDALPNVMITLDDADRHNGCFRLVPGSHRNGFLPGIQDGSRLGPLFTDPEAFDREHQWRAELPAGSLVIFSAHTVHGSEGQSLTPAATGDHLDLSARESSDVQGRWDSQYRSRWTADSVRPGLEIAQRCLGELALQLSVLSRHRKLRKLVDDVLRRSEEDSRVCLREHGRIVV